MSNPDSGIFTRGKTVSPMSSSIIRMTDTNTTGTTQKPE